MKWIFFLAYKKKYLNRNNAKCFIKTGGTITILVYFPVYCYLMQINDYFFLFKEHWEKYRRKNWDHIFIDKKNL